MKDKEYFKGLESLRTIACLFVLSSHLFQQFFSSLHFPNSTIKKTVYFFFQNGGAGVQFFFVLSGFLITSLILKEVKTTNNINLTYFYYRRILRIWPLYFLALFLGFFVYPWAKSIVGYQTSFSAQNPWYYFTFLSNFDVLHVEKFHKGLDSAVIDTTWSIGVEEQFYLFWPILFMLVPGTRIPFLIISILIGSLSFQLYNFMDELTNYYHTISCMVNLSFGGLIAYLSIQENGFINRIKTTPLLLRIFIHLSTLCFLSFNPFNLTYLPIKWIFILYSGYIIIEQCYNQKASKVLSKFKILPYLSKYTYGLYLLHSFVELFTGSISKFFSFPINHSSITWFLIGSINLILSILVSIVVYRYYEKPFLKIKEKY